MLEGRLAGMSVDHHAADGIDHVILGGGHGLAMQISVRV